MHESGYDASLTFNTQVRRSKAADTNLPQSMLQVDAVCAPLCGERGLVVLRDLALPRQSYWQTFTRFDSIESCDGVLNSKWRLGMMVRDFRG